MDPNHPYPNERQTNMKRGLIVFGPPDPELTLSQLIARALGWPRRWRRERSDRLDREWEDEQAYRRWVNSLPTTENDTES